MSTSGSTNTTNNYQLTKPLASDTYDVEVFNNNMDKLDKINLPIGSVIWNKNQINPSDYYYGTWEAVEDVFILAASQNYPSGSIGGEANVTLTIDEIPEHQHPGLFYNNEDKTPISFIRNSSTTKKGYGIAYTINANIYSAANIQTYASGGGQAHNNMPPYKSYYCWERIS